MPQPSMLIENFYFYFLCMSACLNIFLPTTFLVVQVISVYRSREDIGFSGICVTDDNELLFGF